METNIIIISLLVIFHLSIIIWFNSITHFIRFGKNIFTVKNHKKLRKIKKHKNQKSIYGNYKYIFLNEK